MLRHSFVILVLLTMGTAMAQEVEVTVDESLVYFGDPLNFRNPATVDIERVFNKIPEYRQIVDEAISSQDARYWDLISQANAKFQARLEVVAGETGHDLICGAIQYADGRVIPDITELVIEAFD